MNENDIKALFPEGVEKITISKNDYDRLYGQLTYENIVLQSKIDKVNELLEERKESVEDISWVEMKVEDYIEEINEIEFILKEDK